MSDSDENFEESSVIGVSYRYDSDSNSDREENDDGNETDVGNQTPGNTSNQGFDGDTEVKDEPIEFETEYLDMDDIEENVEEVEDENGEELYNCDICDMNFTDIVMHIKKYHFKQDVIVKVEKDSDSSGQSDVPTSQSQKTSNFQDAFKKSLAIRNLRMEQPATVTEINIKSILNNEPMTMNKIEIDENDDTLSENEMDRQEPIDDVMVVEHIDDNLTIRDEADRCARDNTKPVQLVMKEDFFPPRTKSFRARVRWYVCDICNQYRTNQALALRKHKTVLHYKEYAAQRLKEWELSKNEPRRRKPRPKPEYIMIEENRPVSMKGIDVKFNDKVMPYKRLRTVAQTGAVIDPNDEESRKCDICNTVFHNEIALRLHLRMHTGEMKKVNEQIQYEQRLKILDKDGLFHCEQCNKSFELSHLEIHKKFHIHGTELSCSICNKHFKDKMTLDMHAAAHTEQSVPKELVGGKIRRYPCQYCGKRFVRPHEKVKHERIHTGEKPHECEICGKRFRIAYCLTIHLRTHTNLRPYACPICDKSFKSHSVYNHHINIHNNILKYQCPYCPKAFKTSVQLSGHKNCHLKPFSCTVCNRPFSNLYMVRKHMKYHDRANGLPFKCKFCGAAYARNLAVAEHINAVHSEVTRATNSLIEGEPTMEGHGKNVYTVESHDKQEDDSGHSNVQPIVGSTVELTKPINQAKATKFTKRGTVLKKLLHGKKMYVLGSPQNENIDVDVKSNDNDGHAEMMIAFGEVEQFQNEEVVTDWVLN